MRSTQSQRGGLSKWTITTGAWILAGILVITASLIFSGRQEKAGFPSITNTKPSGYAAFAELLKRDGYQLSLERAARLDLSGADLIISTEFSHKLEPNSFQTFVEESDDTIPGYVAALQKFIESGGTVLTIQDDQDFERARTEVHDSSDVESASNSKEKYSLSLPFAVSISNQGRFDSTPYTGWYLGDTSYVNYTKVGNGLMVTVAEGMPITNHFLPDRQNAEFFLRLVHSLAKPGAKIKFVEVGIGNTITPSPANMLGGWAVAARWQAVILFVVVVFTLGRRFGVPIRDSRSVQGSRELFDAVADVLRRSHNTGLALDNLLHECDVRIRRTLRQPSNTSRSTLLQQVPTPLREQYLNVSELAVSKCTPTVAAASAARLLELLQAFEADSRTSRGNKTA